MSEIEVVSSDQVTSDGKVRCDACPVMCYVKPGMTGACDRYANQDGRIVRVDGQGHQSCGHPCRLEA